MTRQDLPSAMRAPIESRADAEAFLTALHAAGLDYHFDDGAVDCLYGNGLVDKDCAGFINGQVNACYEAFELAGADPAHDCPIGFMLVLMERDGQLPA